MGRVAAARLVQYDECDKFHEDNPYLDWPQFLIKQAEAGNTTALRILRAREEHFGPDANKPEEKEEKTVIPYRELLELRASYAKKIWPLWLTPCLPIMAGVA